MNYTRQSVHQSFTSFTQSEPVAVHHFSHLSSLFFGQNYDYCSHPYRLLTEVLELEHAAAEPAFARLKQVAAAVIVSNLALGRCCLCG